MRKRLVLLICIVLLLSLSIATIAQAATTKYTFNDVVIGETTVEIQASVKTTNKADFSTCSYFEDDYADYLGYYTAPLNAGDTAEEVLAFCVDNFDNRDPG